MGASGLLQATLLNVMEIIREEMTTIFLFFIATLFTTMTIAAAVALGSPRNDMEMVRRQRGR